MGPGCQCKKGGRGRSARAGSLDCAQRTGPRKEWAARREKEGVGRGGEELGCGGGFGNHREQVALPFFFFFFKTFSQFDLLSKIIK